jgi:hypothetical protein
MASKKLGYYVPYIKCEQINQDGKPCGYITIRLYEYGYKVSLYFFNIRCSIADKVFSTLKQAEQWYNELYNKYNY